MFEGIQNLGQGLLQMAQIITITKQHNNNQQKETFESADNTKSQ